MQKILMNTDGIDYIFGAYDGEAIVTDTPFSRACRAIWVGVGGDIDVTLESGTRLTFKNVPSGGWFEVRATLVHSDATTASELIAVV